MAWIHQVTSEEQRGDSVRQGSAGRLGLEGLRSVHEISSVGQPVRSRPPSGEPVRAVRETCDGLGEGIGEASAHERVGRGCVASRAMTVPDAELSVVREGDGELCGELLDEKQGEEISRPPGCCTAVRRKRTARQSGRPSSLHGIFGRTESRSPSLEPVRLQGHARVADRVGRTSVCPG